MNQKEIQAQENLAIAMTKLAESMKDFQDPIKWQKIVSDAMRGFAGMGQQVINLRALPVPLPGAVEATLQPVGQPVNYTLPATVTLDISEEDRVKMAEKVFEAIKPELTEFGGFVRRSLDEMPAHRLKEIADKVDAGVKPTLEKRKGCVFIKADDKEAYLNL
jgi:hypothetical protein